MSADGLIDAGRGRRRCAWCGDDPLYVAYHDEEWGSPVVRRPPAVREDLPRGLPVGAELADDPAQARAASARRSPASSRRASPRFGARDVARLLGDAGIVRHRGKITSTINNARRALELARRVRLAGRLRLGWEPAPPTRPRRGHLGGLRGEPTTPESTALSKDLKRRGWTFVGPTTIYAFMQAMGLVDDHLEGCDVRREVERARRRTTRPARHAEGASDGLSVGRSCRR